MTLRLIPVLLHMHVFLKVAEIIVVVHEHEQALHYCVES